MSEKIRDGGPDLRRVLVYVRVEVTPIDGGFFRAYSPDMPNCYAYERSANDAVEGFIRHCREVADGRFEIADAMLRAREREGE